MNQREPVVFKSEDSLWQMLAKGMKTWDGRPYDVDNERIARLSRGHWDKHTTSGQFPYYKHDQEYVCFENKATGQVLQFRFRGLRFASWAPGWCFIILGDLLATYDKDGGLMRK